MLDLVCEQLNDSDTTTVREKAYFAGARLDDEELREAPRKTANASSRLGPGPPTRPGATSDSDTTSAPG